jgi:DNA-binding NarL/FixJ family response regulator
MHPREFPLIRLEEARALASNIPDARFAVFEGQSLSPTRGDLDGVIEAIIGFIGSPTDAAAALAQPTQESDSGTFAHLSERELEVLSLLAKGQSNREIADTLVLSERTVERHVSNIYIKLNVSNRVQAAAYAMGNRFPPRAT